MIEATENQNEGTAPTKLLAILQPEDSRRVADALIAKIEQADFDIAAATKSELGECLMEGMRCGIGEAIVSAIGDAVRYSVESCVGSYEMGRIVSNAISEGVQAAAESRKGDE
jgi:hypothetical protein